MMNGRGRDTGPKPGSESSPNNHADFIWSVADLLRGDYKQSEYGSGICYPLKRALLLTVLPAEQAPP